MLFRFRILHQIFHNNWSKRKRQQIRKNLILWIRLRSEECSIKLLTGGERNLRPSRLQVLRISKHQRIANEKHFYDSKLNVL